jgi:hypothetical protein
MIEDGATGLLFDFFDREQLVAKAVQAFAADTSALRDAARARIENAFSFERNSLPAYGALFRELLAAC